jgi:hypothetical protein
VTKHVLPSGNQGNIIHFIMVLLVDNAHFSQMAVFAKSKLQCQAPTMLTFLIKQVR